MSATMVAHLSWAEIKHYTQDIPLQDMSAVSPKILEDLDPRYLATAIAYERGNIELLKQEKAQLQRHSSTSTSKAGQQIAGLLSKKRNRKGLVPVRIKSFDDGGRLTVRLPDSVVEADMPERAKNADGTLVTPRTDSVAGQILQTAIATQAGVVTLDSDSIDIKHHASVAKRPTNPRRLQFDAAWKWIDEHIDEYADDFLHTERAEHSSAKALWSKLATIRRKKEHLERAVRGLREN